LLEKNPDKISWRTLSGNPTAIHLLEANPNKINWRWLSKNTSAIHLLEANPDKIDWLFLSKNPSAIHLLEANPDKINWGWLHLNPAIFQYDYDAMRERCGVFKEDLIKDRFHPRNLIAGKFKDWKIDGFDSESEDEMIILVY
jgi:hypothetical protein